MKAMRLNHFSLDEQELARFVEKLQDFMPGKGYMFLDEINEEFEPVEPSTLARKVAGILVLFEAASRQNFLGDSYLFYRYFTAALHEALQVFTVVQRGSDTFAIPRCLLKYQPNEIESRFLRELFPPVDLEDGNPFKQRFIDWFLSILEDLEGLHGQPALPAPLEQIEAFLGYIYSRDYLRNFRKVTGVEKLFRGPDPVRYMDGEHLRRFFLDNGISTVVDLRGDEEASMEDIPAGESYLRLLDGLGIKRVVVNLSKQEDGRGIGPDYARRASILRDEVARVVEEFVLAEGGVFIHCASGKDRTGIVAAIFQSMAGVDENVIVDDYSASGLDTRPARIEGLLDFIKKEGGVESFLEKAGLAAETILRAKQKLSG